MPVGAFCLFGVACWWLLFVCVVGVFKIFGPLSRPPSAGPPFPWTAQNFALLLSPAGKFVLFFSLCVLSLNFGVFEDRDAQMCTFGLSGCRVGASHDNQRTPNAHIRTSRRFKHHQNSTRKPPEREERMKFLVGESKKKNAKFWAPHPSAPTLRAPTGVGPWLA